MMETTHSEEYSTSGVLHLAFELGRVHFSLGASCRR